MLDVARINRLKFVFVNTKKFIERNALVAVSNSFFVGCCTEYDTLVNVTDRFKNKGAVVVTEDVIRRNVLIVFKADTVTEAHLHNRFRYTAEAGCISRFDGSTSHKGCNLVEYGNQRFGVGKPVFIIFGLNQHALVT